MSGDETRIQELEAQLKESHKEKRKLARELDKTKNLLKTTDELYRTSEKVLSKAYSDLEDLMKKMQDAQEELHQTSRLAAIGEIAGRAAHEILNPLTAIYGRVEEMLRQACPREDQDLFAVMKDILDDWLQKIVDGTFGTYLSQKDQRGKNLAESDARDLLTIHRALCTDRDNVIRHLEFFRKTVERIVLIINDMRGLARESSQPEETNINQLLAETRELVRTQLEKQRVSLSWHLDSGAPSVLADPNEVVQIFSNLIRNAIQAMPSGGSIEVSTCLNEHRVEVRFKDEGCGIAPEHISKLFELGFTTKPKEQGTGLGLSISRRLARKFGGDIIVERSEPAKGTTFLAWFPTAASVEGRTDKAVLPKNYLKPYLREKQELLWASGQLIRQLLMYQLGFAYVIADENCLVLDIQSENRKLLERLAAERFIVGTGWKEVISLEAQQKTHEQTPLKTPCSFSVAPIHDLRKVIVGTFTVIEPYAHPRGQNLPMAIVSAQIIEQEIASNLPYRFKSSHILPWNATVLCIVEDDALFERCKASLDRFAGSDAEAGADARVEAPPAAKSHQPARAARISVETSGLWVLPSSFVVLRARTFEEAPALLVEQRSRDARVGAVVIDGAALIRHGMDIVRELQQIDQDLLWAVIGDSSVKAHFGTEDGAAPLRDGELVFIDPAFDDETFYRAIKNLLLVWNRKYRQEHLIRMLELDSEDKLSEAFQVKRFLWA